MILFGHAVPFNEPIVAHGPFVMNTREEIVAAFEDYQQRQVRSAAGPVTGLIGDRNREDHRLKPVPPVTSKIEPHARPSSAAYWRSKVGELYSFPWNSDSKGAPL